jgi:RNA-directed DNA polymerase
METWSTLQLVQEAEKSLGEERAIDLGRYAKKLMDKGVAVVFNLSHLSKITGVDHDALYKTVCRRRESSNYRLYRIRKRSGGVRFIHSVAADLLRVQQFINREILQKCQPHTSSFAFHPSGGIRKCASQHRGARWIFQFDLRDFFYSVNEVDCYRIFRAIGYSRILSFELGRICTTTHLPKINKKILHEVQDLYFNLSETSPRYSYKKFHAYPGLRYYDLLGVLPQGAPSSPMLSNLAAAKLDEALHKFALDKSFVYTRYADDIAISGISLPPFMDRGSVCKEIVQLIRKTGFRENKKKIRVAGPGSRRTVLGLLVDGEQPRISNETYRRIDRYLYACKKYGLSATALHERFDSAFGFHNHLSGLIAFVKDVDPPRFENFISRFRQIPIPWEV